MPHRTHPSLRDFRRPVDWAAVRPVSPGGFKSIRPGRIGILTLLGGETGCVAALDVRKGCRFAVRGEAVDVGGNVRGCSHGGRGHITGDVPAGSTYRATFDVARQSTSRATFDVAAAVDVGISQATCLPGRRPGQRSSCGGRRTTLLRSWGGMFTTWAWERIEPSKTFLWKCLKHCVVVTRTAEAETDLGIRGVEANRGVSCWVRHMGHQVPLTDEAAFQALFESVGHRRHPRVGVGNGKMQEGEDHRALVR